MHAREATLEEAAVFTSTHTPRGWLSLARPARPRRAAPLPAAAGVRDELPHGKIQIEQLLADRRRQLGDAFTFKRFMDEFDAAGQIPISLIRWELTGELADDLRDVLSPAPA